MSEIPVEKRLELIQQVRSQYHKNQCDLQTREQILYGKTSASVRQEEPIEIKAAGAEAAEEETVSFLKIRVMGAVVLFLIVLMLDISGASLFGLCSEQFFEQLSKDYQISELLPVDSNRTGKN